MRAVFARTLGQSERAAKGCPPLARPQEKSRSLPSGLLPCGAGASPATGLQRLRVPAELLGLAGGALRDHDVDEGGTAVVHRLGEGALQVLRVLDEEALAAEGFHHPVVAGAVDQRV